MRGTALAIALVAIACVSSATQVCEDGRLCPEGTTCHAVAATQSTECVTPDQLAMCDGMEDGTSCLAGTCYSGACLPAGCGNDRDDEGEACDDGNTTAGDGCSTDCRSAEVCGNGIVDPVRLDEMQQPQAFEQCDDGAVMSHDGCSSLCRAEVPRWQRRGDAPRSRVQAAMAHDEARERLVMFGGDHVTTLGPGGLLNDTWVLGPDGWRQLRMPLSPVARTQHALAYDGTRVVLFGGTANSSLVFDDTWVLERDEWKRLSPTMRPPPRYDHAMAYMPSVGIVMFGGVQKGGLLFFNDTWVFRDGEWTELALDPRPAIRARHAMAYDPVRDRIVLTSGATDANFPIGDTWEFDGTQWLPIPNANTPRLFDAAIAFDGARGKVVLHGGTGEPGIIGDATVRGDHYEWDGSTWTMIGQGPLLTGEAAAPHPAHGKMVLFGGIPDPTGNPCAMCELTSGETFTLDGDAWVGRAPATLAATARHAAALDPDRGVVVVYGGDAGSSSTYELGDADWQAKTVLGSPPRQSGAAMAFGGGDMNRGIILFVDGQTWRWNGTAWQRLFPATSPTSRQNHAMVYDAARDRIVLHGGSTGGDETWEWDGTTWIERTGLPSESPPFRQAHAMAYDPIRQRVIVFGGYDLSLTAHADMWSWDGTTWTELEPPLLPSPRSAAGMAWDAARQRIVLYGEAAGDELWEWDGTSWSVIPVFDPPLARSQHALVSSPTGAGVIAIAGRIFGLNPTNDTLHLTFGSLASTAACWSTIDDDFDGVAGCDDPDCWSTCSPWCPPGTTCNAALPRCGDSVCEPARETCALCSECC